MAEHRAEIWQSTSADSQVPNQLDANENYAEQNTAQAIVARLETAQQHAAEVLGACIVRQVQLGDKMPFQHFPIDQQQAEFFEKISLERAYQDGIYGPVHERTMSPELWLKILRDYSEGHGRAVDYDFNTRMLKSAAICLAALQWNQVQ